MKKWYWSYKLAVREILTPLLHVQSHTKSDLSVVSFSHQEVESAFPPHEYELTLGFALSKIMWHCAASKRGLRKSSAFTSGMLRGAPCKDIIPPLEDNILCAGEPMVTTVSKAVWDLWASCITKWPKVHGWEQKKVHPAHPDWADPQDNNQAHDWCPKLLTSGMGLPKYTHLLVTSQAHVLALHVFSAGTFSLIFSTAGSFFLFRHQRITSPSPDHPKEPPVHLEAPHSLNVQVDVVEFSPPCKPGDCPVGSSLPWDQVLPPCSHVEVLTLIAWPVFWINNTFIMNL